VEKEKAVQGRVHNQVCHREGRIGTETELRGHEEAFGKEKGKTMLGIATEKEERKQPEPMAKREEVSRQRRSQAIRNPSAVDTDRQLRQEWHYLPVQVVMVGMIQHY
jgi:hypothetical protein